MRHIKAARRPGQVAPLGCGLMIRAPTLDPKPTPASPPTPALAMCAEAHRLVSEFECLAEPRPRPIPSGAHVARGRYTRSPCRYPGSITGNVAGISMYVESPIHESDPTGVFDWVSSAVSSAAGAIGGAVSSAASAVSGAASAAKSAASDAARRAQEAAAATARRAQEAAAATARRAQEAAAAAAAAARRAREEAERIAREKAEQLARAREAAERMAAERMAAAKAEAEKAAADRAFAAREAAERAAAERVGVGVGAGVGLGVPGILQGAVTHIIDASAPALSLIVGLAEQSAGGLGGSAISAITGGLVGSLPGSDQRGPQDAIVDVAAQREAEARHRAEEAASTVARDAADAARAAQIAAEQQQRGGGGISDIFSKVGGAISGAAESAISGGMMAVPGLGAIQAGYQAGQNIIGGIIEEIPQSLPETMSLTGAVKVAGDVVATTIGKGASEILYAPMSNIYEVVTGTTLDSDDRQRMKDLQDAYIRDAIYNIYATPGHVVDLATALIDVVDETFGTGEFERTQLADAIKRGIFARDEIGVHVPGSLTGLGTQYDRDELKRQAIEEWSGRVGEEHGAVAGGVASLAGDIISMWHDMPVVEGVMWSGGKLLGLGAKIGGPLSTALAVEQIVPAIHDALFPETPGGGGGGGGGDPWVDVPPEWTPTTPQDPWYPRVEPTPTVTPAESEYLKATREYEEEARRYESARAEIERQYMLDQAEYERQLEEYQMQLEREYASAQRDYEQQLIDYQAELDRDYESAQEDLLYEFEKNVGEYSEATEEYQSAVREYEEHKAALDGKYLAEMEKYQRQLDAQYQAEMEEYQRQVDEYAWGAEEYQRQLDAQYQAEMEEYQRQVDEADAQRQADYLDAMRAAQDRWVGDMGIGMISDALYGGHSDAMRGDGGWGYDGWVVEPYGSEVDATGAVTDIGVSAEGNNLLAAGAAGAAILAGLLFLSRSRSGRSIPGGTF